MRYYPALRQYVVCGQEGGRKLYFSIGRGGFRFWWNGLTVGATPWHRPQVHLVAKHRLVPRILRDAYCRHTGHLVKHWVVNYDAYECRCKKRSISGPSMWADSHRPESK